MKDLSSKTAAEGILVGIVQGWLWRVKGLADSQIVQVLEVVAIVAIGRIFKAQKVRVK